MTNEPAPSDVVPPKGITADVIRALDSAQHHPVTITFPGDVLTDPNGLPVGMTEPRTVSATLTARVSRDDLTRNGLTPTEVPNVHTD